MTEVHTIGAALLAGLVTSVHCAGMCGPLACSVGSLPSNDSARQRAQVLYHLGRLLSYGSIGALCGALGQQPLRWVFGTPAVVLPWLLVVLFLITAFGLWKRLPHPPVFARLTARLRLRALRLSATRGGFLLGLATPVLPCAPLYLLFGACLLTGSAVRGAEFALAFGVGTVPLLWLAQQSLGRLRDYLPRMHMIHLQRGLALLAALLMCWRLQDTLPFFEDRTTTTDAAGHNPLPSCCPTDP